VTTTVTSDVDLFSDAAIADPYDHYRRLRDLGPVVWLPRHQVWCLSRYAEVRTVLADWESFSSARGVAMNDFTNEILVGTTIASDPPVHDHLRGVIGERLTPRAVRTMRAAVEERADLLVDSLVARGSFEVVADLARALPQAIVPDLLGLPDHVRPKMLGWAAAGFETMGPMNARTEACMAGRRDLWESAVALAASGDFIPGSLGSDLLAAVGRGDIDQGQCPALLLDYLVPALDTTISSVGSAVWLFGRFPDQWDRVRADPALIPRAFNEVLRFESPVRGFSRVATADVDLSGTTIPAGDRVLVLYGSANRDERQWVSPDVFDVTRDAAGQLAFGYGVHGCAGQGLARLEAHSVLAALVRRVERFEIGEPVHVMNNMIRGLERLDVTVVPAA
jgi:cytochrome P450